MDYLLDTCALSEMVAYERNRKAEEAILALPRESIYLSAISVGEINCGILEMATGAKKTFLTQWFHEHVLGLYVNRTLPLDTIVAIRWGALDAEMKRRGLTMQTTDAIIAATALHHGMTVVTRNVADFEDCGVSIFNPWT
jgi:predicted nucleic acid-binding protein